MLTRLGVLVLSCLLAPAAWGQSEPSDTTASVPEPAMEGALEEVVVTASRLPERARTTGRRVDVWTAAEIEALPVTSFDELLRTVGGVEVQSRGGFGVQSDLTMRGSTFNGVLVLIDGARLNDPMVGHFLSDLPLPLTSIARIEVLRGPATALYGADAVGGVIHIQTYAGLTDAPHAPAEGAEASGHAGRHGLYEVDGALRQPLGRAALVTAATAWQGTDGQDVVTHEGVAIRAADGPVRTDFRRQAHTLALAARRGDARLYARAGFDDRDFGAFRFYTPFPSDTAREATQTLWAQARLQHGSDHRGWTAHLAAKQHEDRYVYNPQTPANEHTSRLLTAQLLHRRPLGRRVDVSAATDGALRGISSNNIGERSDASGGASAVARWRASDALTVTAGGRIDADPGYGLEASPHVQAAYVPSGRWGLRASAGRAVRAPNYVERYFNTLLARPRGRDLGNPDLDAERAWSAEAGADLYPAAGIALHATAFARRTRDLIDWVKLTPTDTVFLARNLHTVRTRGLELDAEASAMLGPGRLRASATYTRLAADLGAVDPAATYKYALTNARHLVQAAGTYALGPATLGARWLWKDRREGDRYGVLDAQFGLRLTRHVAATAEVRNVLDRRYYEVFDAPMPERWWIVGLRVSG